MTVSADRFPAELTVRTILIVDDDQSVTETFARMLQLEGFTVATALGASLRFTPLWLEDLIALARTPVGR
ncbi:MAG: hypothetical protein ABIP65_04695 [Vicinamibacterales bacterium]